MIAPFIPNWIKKQLKRPRHESQQIELDALLTEQEQMFEDHATCDIEEEKPTNGKTNIPFFEVTQ